MDTLSDIRIEAWIDARGPARRDLLAPVGTELAQRPVLPSDHVSVVEPALWLLERAGGKGLPLDGRGTLRRDFATTANARLGFDSPELTEHGHETFLEIDMLFNWLRGLGATITVRSKEFLSHLGSEYLHDRHALWYSLASCLGLARPDGFHGEMWELVLAWLLQEQSGISSLSAPVDEAALAYGLECEDESFDSAVEVAFFSLYTGLRALRAFVPKDEVDPAKPRLTAPGRRAAVEGLRACVAVGELV